MFTTLRDWRIAQEKTVAQAAEAAGVTPAMWSRWENNRRDVPPKRVQSLATLTGIPREKLRPDVFGEAQQ
jgi:transcriptional regulator with XRE-family HTH domain